MVILCMAHICLSMEWTRNCFPFEYHAYSLLLQIRQGPWLLATTRLLYDWRLEQGIFKPELAPNGGHKSEGLFVISGPRPNVVGSLHFGHALTTAI